MSKINTSKIQQQQKSESITYLFDYREKYIYKMAVSLFDILVVMMGLLVVVKYFTSTNNKKTYIENPLVTKKNNKYIKKYNDGDKIILYYDVCDDNCMMEFNYNVKYDILHDYNQTQTNENEIEVIYI